MKGRHTLAMLALAAMPWGFAYGAQGNQKPAPAAAPAPANTCTVLAGSKKFQHTEIRSATVVPATDGLPAYCEVQGVIRPEPGSEIGVVFRLPQEWNGKVLALGGGGWMGNITLQAAREGLGKGYATLQTDAGHSNGTGFDASAWAINADGSANQPRLRDFSYRGIHMMTELGKLVVNAHYGKAASRSYYQGCSTGGRMGLMEVQLYPEDFDGVIAGAPVYTLQTQTSAQLRTVAFEAPGARLLPAHLSLLQKAVLAACDAKDGAADGVLRDPRACTFDPQALQCKAGQSGESCLTPAQVAAVRRVYAGEDTSDGSTASYPLEKGGENGWLRFVPSTEAGDPGTNSGGMHALRGPLLGDPAFDLSKFKADDVTRVRSSWLAEVYEAQNPDIAKFVDRGGKLLMYHGFNDPGPSARATVEYFQAALRRTKQATGSARLFLAPGMGHCSGGDGPDRVDWLGALEGWVEQGTVPEELPATKANSTLAWNLCAYPKLPTGQPGGTYACK
jgi:feruloyl esterase